SEGRLIDMATRYIPLSEDVFRSFMENTMGFQQVAAPGELVWERVIPQTMESIRVASSIRPYGVTTKGKSVVRVYRVNAVTEEILTVPKRIRRGPNVFVFIREQV